MNPFYIDELFAPTILIYLVSLYISFKYTKWLGISLLIAFIKSGLYLIYYGYLFDGTYTFLDDWTYFEGGYKLTDRGVTFFNFYNHWEYVKMIGRGDHFVYYLYNAVAFQIFTIGYYAPVSLNILFTIIFAFYGTKLIELEFKLSKRYAKLFFIFLMCHPSILSWSTVMNGKDIIILFFHLLILISISCYFRGKILKFMIIILPSILILLFLRFYIPFIFGVVFIVTALIKYKNMRHKKYLIYIFLIGVTSFYSTGSGLFESSLTVAQNHIVNPVLGLIRFLLTPVPFRAEENYSFLNFAALANWFLMPFLIFGILSLYKTKTIFIRYFLLYFIVFVLLYAFVGELQGPRHRVQILYPIAVLQMIGILNIINKRKVTI